MSLVDISDLKNELDIDNDTLKDIYSLFIEEILDENKKMYKSQKDGNAKDLKATVHNIKGISGNVKAKNIYDKASKLNELLANDENGDIERLINEISDAIREAVKDIEDFFGV